MKFASACHFLRVLVLGFVAQVSPYPKEDQDLLSLKKYLTRKTLFLYQNTMVLRVKLFKRIMKHYLKG